MTPINAAKATNAKNRAQEAFTIVCQIHLTMSKKKKSMESLVYNRSMNVLSLLEHQKNVALVLIA